MPYQDRHPDEHFEFDQPPPPSTGRLSRVLAGAGGIQLAIVIGLAAAILVAIFGNY